MHAVVRAETLAAHKRPYVEAARSLGLSNPRIVLRYILPDVLSPIVVIATFSVALMMIQEATLSFLELGVPPNVPSWGGMLSDGRNYLSVAWWLGTLPGVAILIAVSVARYPDRSAWPIPQRLMRDPRVPYEANRLAPETAADMVAASFPLWTPLRALMPQR